MSGVDPDVSRFLGSLGNCDYAAIGRTLPIARRRGKRIRQLRKAQNIDQPEMARRLGISTGYLSELEIGKLLGAEDLYQRAAALLGVVAADLDLEVA